MLYKDYHIDQIRTGSKTVTRREWDQPQVKVGGVYMAASPSQVPEDADARSPMFLTHDDCTCYIQVTALYEQPLGAMTDADAQQEGDYETLDEFIDGYERVYGDGAWDPEKTVWVVNFRYVGREKPGITRRMMGCPNCPIPNDFEQAQAILMDCALGARTFDTWTCERHYDQFEQGTKEYVEAQR